VGFIPILQGLKGDFFLPSRGDEGVLPLEDGDKPHPYMGFRGTLYVGFRRAIFED
jgi:hypothetical protein